MSNDENVFVSVRECGEYRKDIHNCIKTEISLTEQRFRGEFDEIKGYMKILIAAIIGILAETTLALLSLLLR